MQDLVSRLYFKMQGLKDAFVKDESGQDLIEYALVVSLIALAATVSMKAVASSVSTAFTAVGSKLTTYTS